jgi:hypothetical protein
MSLLIRPIIDSSIPAERGETKWSGDSVRPEVRYLDQNAALDESPSLYILNRGPVFMFPAMMVKNRLLYAQGQRVLFCLIPQNFWARSCLYVNLDATHHCIETSFIIQKISRASLVPAHHCTAIADLWIFQEDRHQAWSHQATRRFQDGSTCPTAWIRRQPALSSIWQGHGSTIERQ